MAKPEPQDGGAETSGLLLAAATTLNGHIGSVPASGGHTCCNADLEPVGPCGPSEADPDVARVASGVTTAAQPLSRVLCQLPEGSPEPGPMLTGRSVPSDDDPGSRGATLDPFLRYLHPPYDLPDPCPGPRGTEAACTGHVHHTSQEEEHSASQPSSEQACVLSARSEGPAAVPGSARAQAPVCGRGPLPGAWGTGAMAGRFVTGRDPSRRLRQASEIGIGGSGEGGGYPPKPPVLEEGDGGFEGQGWVTLGILLAGLVVVLVVLFQLLRCSPPKDTEGEQDEGDQDGRQPSHDQATIGQAPQVTKHPGGQAKTIAPCAAELVWQLTAVEPQSGTVEGFLGRLLVKRGRRHVKGEEERRRRMMNVAGTTECGGNPPAVVVGPNLVEVSLGGTVPTVHFSAGHINLPNLTTKQSGRQTRMVRSGEEETGNRKESILDSKSVAITAEKGSGASPTAHCTRSGEDGPATRETEPVQAAPEVQISSGVLSRTQTQMTVRTPWPWVPMKALFAGYSPSRSALRALSQWGRALHHWAAGVFMLALLGPVTKVSPIVQGPSRHRPESPDTTQQGKLTTRDACPFEDPTRTDFLLEAYDLLTPSTTAPASTLDAASSSATSEDDSVTVCRIGNEANPEGSWFPETGGGRASQGGETRPVGHPSTDASIPRALRALQNNEFWEDVGGPDNGDRLPRGGNTPVEGQDGSRWIGQWVGPMEGLKQALHPGKRHDSPEDLVEGHGSASSGGNSALTFPSAHWHSTEKDANDVADPEPCPIPSSPREAQRMETGDGWCAPEPVLVPPESQVIVQTTSLERQLSDDKHADCGCQPQPPTSPLPQVS